MSDARVAPEPWRLVRRLEGRIEGCLHRGTYEPEPATDDPGEYEYVFVVRVPSAELSSRSEKLLTLEVPSDDRVDFEIEVEVDLADPRKGNDKLVLRADDGSYRKEIVVVDEGLPHPERPGFTVVMFKGVPPDKAYSCTVDPGPEEGPPYPLFVARRVS